MIRFWVAAFMALLGAALATYSYLDHRQVATNAGERLAVLANVMASNIQSQLSMIDRQLTALRQLNGIQRQRDPAAEGLAVLEAKPIDLVVQDMNFSGDTTSGEEGVALFRAIRARSTRWPE